MRVSAERHAFISASSPAVESERILMLCVSYRWGGRHYSHSCSVCVISDQSVWEHCSRDGNKGKMSELVFSSREVYQRTQGASRKELSAATCRRRMCSDGHINTARIQISAFSTLQITQTVTGDQWDQIMLKLKYRGISYCRALHCSNILLIWDDLCTYSPPTAIRIMSWQHNVSTSQSKIKAQLCSTQWLL